MAGLSQVFDNRVPDYFEFREEVAKTFVEVIIPGTAGAETSLKQTVEAATKLQVKAYQSYGIIAGEGDSKIGPRHLVIPTEQATGKLGIERTFEISNSPYDEVHITVRKTGGKGGVNLAACVTYPNGSSYTEKRTSIAHSGSSIGDEVKLSFSNMENDKIITLHLVKTGLPPDQVEYSVTVEGAFNAAKLADLYQPTSALKETPKIPTLPQPVKQESTKRVATPKVKKH
ncbi:MAG: hypothetical protein AAF399_06405 [Bacteroidota bacterium]